MAGLQTFRVKSITKFSEILEKGLGDNAAVIGESELCFHNNEVIVQFEAVNKETEESKYKIKPGVYSFQYETGGLCLKAVEARKRELLATVMNTSSILKEANLFFSRLDVYERLNLPKKRGVLLYSDPGMGKSAAISQFIADSTTADPGTVVILWPTSKVSSDDVSAFLNAGSVYLPECTKLILVMEDIGGAVHEGYDGPRQTDAAMLNLLDGVDVTFKLPTFIIATTNFPQNLLSSLAYRPGRFDLFIELKAPGAKERCELLELIAKRALTDEEKKIFTSNKDADSMSIAHLEEIVVRSALHDKTIIQTFKELVDHKKRFKDSFENKKGRKGMGFGDDD